MCYLNAHFKISVIMRSVNNLMCCFKTDYVIFKFITLPLTSDQWATTVFNGQLVTQTNV